MCKNKIEVGTILKCTHPFNVVTYNKDRKVIVVPVFISSKWKVKTINPENNNRIELVPLSRYYLKDISTLWIYKDINLYFKVCGDKVQRCPDKQVYASIAVEWVEKYNKYKKKDEKIDTGLIMGTLIQADIQTIKYFTEEIIQLIAFEKSNRPAPMERGYTDTANAINTIKNKRCDYV